MFTNGNIHRIEAFVKHVADERPIKIAWHKGNDESNGRYKRRIDELIPNMIMSSDTLFCNKVHSFKHVSFEQVCYSCKHGSVEQV